MLSQCIFACKNVKCSNDNTNSYSFRNIICQLHLKTVFGLKQAIYRQETQNNSDLSGPFLMPDDNFEFEKNTVIFPEKAFLEHVLQPEYNGNVNENNMYNLNPRMLYYYNNLQTLKMDQPESLYHYELIRNLDVIDTVKNVDVSQKQSLAHTGLVTHIQDRLSNLYNWIRNEPYYQVFKSLLIYPVDNFENPKTLADGFSPFYSFLLYNCLFDKTYLPIPHQNMNDSAPLTLYSNLVYKSGIGFVTTKVIKNNAFLVSMGEIKGHNAYFNFKCKHIPKASYKPSLQTSDLPDSLRNLNVLSGNQNYCNYNRRYG